MTAGEATRPVPRGAGINLQTRQCAPMGRGASAQTYSNGNRATLAALLCGQRVWVAERCAPVSSSDRQHAQLRNDDGGADGGGDLFGRLDAESDVAFGVANDHDGLESGTLSGTGLLLDGLDL